MQREIVYLVLFNILNSYILYILNYNINNMLVLQVILTTTYFLSKEDIKTKTVSTYKLLFIIFISFFYKNDNALILNSILNNYEILNTFIIEKTNSFYIINNFINTFVILGIITFINLIISYLKNIDSAIGDGDYPLIIIIGIVFTYKSLIVLSISSLISILYYIFKYFITKDKNIFKDTIPFIPFLGIGLLIGLYILKSN